MCHENRAYDTEFPATTLVTQAIQAVRKHHTANKEQLDILRGMMGHRGYILEHCTLRIKFPRQMGNTVAAAHASKLLGIRASDPNSGYVIVPYQAQRHVIAGYGAENIALASGIRGYIQVGSIVVDAADRIRPSDINLLADLIDPSKDGLLVLIG